MEITTQGYYVPTRQEQNAIDGGDAAMVFFFCGVWAAWSTVKGYYRNKWRRAAWLAWEVEQKKEAA